MLAEHPDHDFIHSELLDVDRDGDPDWIGARYDPGLIVWLENPGSGAAAPWTARTVDDQVHGIHGLLVGDVDADGHPDLIANGVQPKGEFPESVVWYRTPDRPTETRPAGRGSSPRTATHRASRTTSAAAISTATVVPT